MNIISRAQTVPLDSELYYLTASTRMIQTALYMGAFNLFFTYHDPKGHRIIGAHHFRFTDPIDPSTYLSDLAGVTHIPILVDYDGYVDHNVYQEWQYLKNKRTKFEGYFPDGRSWARIDLQPILSNPPERFAVLRNLITGEQSDRSPERKGTWHG